MCWTTATPGAVAGSASSTARSASVPPVEAPITTIRSVVRASGRPPAGGGSTASAVSFSVTSNGARGWRGLSLARAAERIASQTVTRLSSRNCRVPMRGLVMISTAPAPRARIAVSDPASASEEQMTTGIGRWLMIFWTNVMPSIRGISMSQTITSGASARILSAAN